VRPLVLVAHGSADPRAGATTRRLARAVAAASGRTVREAYLDHDGPRPGDVLAELAGRRPVVVPLLLTDAYHGRVDLPAVLAGHDAELADVLGPVDGVVPAPLLAALARRLRECGSGYDAVVLAAAGTRDPTALSTVELSAAALGARLGVPCRVGYASGPGPRPDQAVAALAGRGARRVAVSAYFLAPGRLHGAATGAALHAGARAAAAPLGDAPELVRLVLARARRALVRPATRKAPAPAGAFLVAWAQAE
jgi:sirohydrochlorin ferrochelatase